MTSNLKRNARDCGDCTGKGYTTDTRETFIAGFPALRRRRKCVDCGKTWSTYEVNFEVGKYIRKYIKLLSALKATLKEDIVIDLDNKL